MPQTPYILVVDDEPLNLQVFEYNFGEEFPLLYAPNAEKALEALATANVAAIIADHRMPGMLGLDLLALVAQRSPAIVRVLLTAPTDVPLLVDAVNRGVLFR
jgi:DNA-binding NtrC family response regulator